MEQFYEPPKQTHRTQIHSLFQQKENNPETHNFVPFNQQRDYLGHLLSAEKKSDFRFRSIQGSSKFSSQSNVSQKQKVSNHTVERIFKVHSIPNLHINKDKVFKINSGQKSIAPAVGQYDFAQSADKLKFKRTNQFALKQKSKSLSHHNPILDHKQPAIAKLLKSKGREEKSNVIFHSNKLQLDPDLPELRKFHTMQKLQMEISANFERDHERFKKLVRDSMFLAGKIKRQLELD